jgi:hypothetical protein
MERRKCKGELVPNKVFCAILSRPVKRRGHRSNILGKVAWQTWLFTLPAILRYQYLLIGRTYCIVCSDNISPNCVIWTDIRICWITCLDKGTLQRDDTADFNGWSCPWRTFGVAYLCPSRSMRESGLEWEGASSERGLSPITLVVLPWLYWTKYELNISRWATPASSINLNYNFLSYCPAT